MNAFVKEDIAIPENLSEKFMKLFSKIKIEKNINLFKIAYAIEGFFFCNFRVDKTKKYFVLLGF